MKLLRRKITWGLALQCAKECVISLIAVGYLILVAFGGLIYFIFGLIFIPFLFASFESVVYNRSLRDSLEWAGEKAPLGGIILIAVFVVGTIAARFVR